MKHTKGEWRAFELEDTKGDGYWYIESEEFELAGFTGEANAKLIAAAPDLLEACKAARFILSSYANDNSETAGSRCYRKLDEAIKKATD